MRWWALGILVWLAVLVQTTLGGVLAVEPFGVGAVGPDLLAPLAVFVALYVRRSTDALIAAAVMGFALDLSTGGAGGLPTVVGPMALSYALAAKVVFEVREAFFRDRILPRALLTAVLVLIAHGLWVTCQTVLAFRPASWSQYVAMLAQAAMIAVYTAIAAPLEIWLVSRVSSWLIPATDVRTRRRR